MAFHIGIGFLTAIQNKASNFLNQKPEVSYSRFLFYYARSFQLYRAIMIFSVLTFLLSALLIVSI